LVEVVASYDGPTRGKSSVGLRNRRHAVAHLDVACSE
jgi:hypothetical protein